MRKSIPIKVKTESILQFVSYLEQTLNFSSINMYMNTIQSISIYNHNII